MSRRSAVDPAQACSRPAAAGSGGGGETDDPGDVVGTAAQLPFLATAVEDGSEPDAAPHRQRADSLGATKLVAADGHEIRGRASARQIEPRRGLDSVGVQDGARRPPADQRGQLARRAG